MARTSSPLLSPYQSKRDFKKTPEPRAGGKRGGHKLIVQHHRARREHYDLRLEIDGVLASWAVTRVPSANPKDKRLAVRTEDHPLSYADFEGTIPKGQYGGGTVVMWESATYVPLNGSPSEALANGEIKFEVLGNRMKGRWVLVRMRGNEKRENWLLIKEKDEFAESDDGIIRRYQGSVLDTGHGANPPLNRKAMPLSLTKRQPATPEFIPPQLCGTSETVPTSPDWLFEMKYDGYRLQCAKELDAIKLFARSGLDWTSKFPRIVSAARTLDCESCTIDGEVVAFSETGIADFPALVSALETGDSRLLTFVAFDLLKLDGADLRSKPLVERKAKLRGIVGGDVQAFSYASHHQGDGKAVFEAAVAAGAEGIIAKRAHSRYISGRTSEWLKIKGDNRADVTVIGYMPSTKGESFGSLLAAQQVNDKWRYVGRIGTGFNSRVRRQLEPHLANEVLEKPQFSNPVKLPRGAKFLASPFSVEVKFGGWTADGQMRQSRYINLQDDRPQAPLSQLSTKRAPLSPQWRITHADRLVFTNPPVTKGRIAEYYQTVAPRILAHLVNRPVSLLRAPNGIAASTFFQRHPLNGMKAGIGIFGSVPEQYFHLQGESGLASAVQFGTVEFHGWNATLPEIDNPDRVIFDLDPDEALPFSTVIEGANIVRRYLEASGVQSWPMLSGGKGVHLIVPLDRTSTREDVVLFSREIARGIAKEQPDKFVATMSKARRRGLIFIDWLRNRSKATAVIPWSLRAREGVPVATPWNGSD